MSLMTSGGRLIDGVSSEPIEDSLLAIKDGKIVLLELAEAQMLEDLRRMNS